MATSGLSETLPVLTLLAIPAVMAMTFRPVHCAELRKGDAMSEKQAIEVARKWLAESGPEFQKYLNYEAFVQDDGTIWGVSFMPPGQIVTGDVPEFDIEKGTYRILKVGWAQ